MVELHVRQETQGASSNSGNGKTQEAKNELNVGSEDEKLSATEGNLSEPSPQIDLEELVEKYETYLRGQRGLSDNTVRVYLTDLDSYLRYLSETGRAVTDMNRRMARSYLAWLATQARETKHPYSGRKQKEGYARVSIIRKLTALRCFYKFLVQQGLFKHSPVPSGRSLQMKMEKPLPSFIGKQEAVRLLETPEEETLFGIRDRAILEVLYSCGVRLAEIEGMDLPDMKLAQRQILVEGKGSKERWVLFGQPTAEALEKYMGEVRPQLLEGPSEALFLNRYGKRLSRRSIEKLVKGYAARAGLRDGVHTHTLRHTFASHMLEGEADLRVIQELLGHSSPTTTQIYTHITKQEAKNAYLNFHPRAGKV